jgi:hypothetical protein
MRSHGATLPLADTGRGIFQISERGNSFNKGILSLQSYAIRAKQRTKSTPTSRELSGDIANVGTHVV